MKDVKHSWRDSRNESEERDALARQGFGYASGMYGAYAICDLCHVAAAKYFRDATAWPYTNSPWEDPCDESILNYKISIYCMVKLSDLNLKSML